MGIISDILSGGASKIIESVGTAIDKLTTTEEEKIALKNKLESEINDYKIAVMQARNQYEKQLTERLKADMTSDSWLSKNIRPLLLLILTVTTIALAYFTIFTLNVSEVEKVKVWTPLLTTLLTTGYIFYYGSRGFEKIKTIANRDKKMTDNQ